jgi:hypothetical protein
MVGLAIDKGQGDQRRCGNPGQELAYRELSYLHERLASSPAGLMNIMTMKKANAST